MPHDSPASVCVRCGVALAPDYLSHDHRCPPCEVAYFESRDRLNTRGWFAGAFVLPWLLFAWLIATVQFPPAVGKVRGFSTGLPQLDLFIMTAITALLLGSAAVTVRRWFHRRSFESAIVGVSSGRRATP